MGFGKNMAADVQEEGLNLPEVKAEYQAKLNDETAKNIADSELSQKDLNTVSDVNMRAKEINKQNENTVTDQEVVDPTVANDQGITWVSERVEEVRNQVQDKIEDAKDKVVSKVLKGKQNEEVVEVSNSTSDVNSDIV